jgi:hypothetical protein
MVLYFLKGFPAFFSPTFTTAYSVSSHSKQINFQYHCSLVSSVKWLQYGSCCLCGEVEGLVFATQVSCLKLVFLTSFA